jgi:hypothetical protein
VQIKFGCGLDSRIYGILARHSHYRLSYMVKDQYILFVDSIVSYTSIAG